MAPHRPGSTGARQAQSTSWSAVNYLLRSGFSWSGHERNNLFLNLSDGRFVDVSHVAGVDFDDDARGVAVVDWDHDGDLDLWLNNRSSPKARLMRNERGDSGRSWRLLLFGTRSNRDAVGARATLQLADGSALVRTVRAGVNYTVQGSRWLHFGLAAEAELSRLTVRWPDGAVESYAVPPTGSAFVLQEGDPGLRTVRPPDGDSVLRHESWAVGPHSRTASVPLGRPLELPPDLSMIDFDGREHPIAEGGRPTLVNLWASWCAPCRTEFEDFDDHRRLLDRQDLQILACSVDEDPAAAETTARALGVRFPVGMCDQRLLGVIEATRKAVFDQYEDLLLPTSVLLDGEGRLARIYVGPADAERLAADVAALRQATDDVERLQLAERTDGGIWARPEVWLESQRGRQLVQMTQLLSRQGRSDLLRFYAGTLADYLEARDRPERALATATDTLLEAAQALAIDDAASAVVLYRRVLAYRPDDAPLLWNLAWAMADSEGVTAEAQRVVDRALSVAPEASDARDAALRGLVLQRFGHLERAVTELEAALAADPEDQTLQLALTAAEETLSSRRSTLDSLRRRAADQPDDSVAALALARALDAAGDVDEARRFYLRYVENAGGEAAAADLGPVLYRLGRWEEAAAVLAGTVAADVERYAEQRMLGLALARAGRDAEARRHLEAAGAHLPADAEAEYILGLVRARTGDLQTAVSSFERTLELRPDRAEVVLSLARAYEGLGDAERAVEQFRRYLRIEPTDSEARYRLARNLEAVGRMDEALALYRGIVERAPEQSSARYRLGWLLATSAAPEHRDAAEALAIARALIEESPPHPALLDLLAAAYAENGRFEDAERTAAAAVTMADDAGADELAATIRGRLTLYRSGRPFHGES